VAPSVAVVVARVGCFDDEPGGADPGVRAFCMMRWTMLRRTWDASDPGGGGTAGDAGATGDTEEGGGFEQTVSGVLPIGVPSPVLAPAGVTIALPPPPPSPPLPPPPPGVDVLRSRDDKAVS
jgi:hypothetical protein